MNSEQAKFILRAFRPGVDRKDAPEFVQAFDQLRQDDQLARWFEREMAADAAIRKKLSEAVRFPAGLKERIAATGKVVRPAPQSWWRRPALLALAASVVLLLTFGVLNFGGDRSQAEGFAAFRESVVSASQASPHVSFMDADLGRVREYLRSEEAPEDLAIPAGLNLATLKGCRILEWNGRKVSLVCLHLNDGGHVDLFVIRDVEWDRSGPGLEPLLAHIGQRNTASWSKGALTYILVANASDEELRRLLSV
jgi:hypothetical protein